MRPLVDKLLGHIRGRKFAGLMVVVLALLLCGWSVAPDKISPVTIALVGSYSAFVASHSYSDVNGKREPEAK